MRLNIAAGTAVRFEPGDTREVELVALGGRREVYGLNGLVERRARRRGGPRASARSGRSFTAIASGRHVNKTPKSR